MVRVFFPLISVGQSTWLCECSIGTLKNWCHSPCQTWVLTEQQQILRWTPVCHRFHSRTQWIDSSSSMQSFQCQQQEKNETASASNQHAAPHHSQPLRTPIESCEIKMVLWLMLAHFPAAKCIQKSCAYLSEDYLLYLNVFIVFKFVLS